MRGPVVRRPVVPRPVSPVLRAPWWRWDPRAHPQVRLPPMHPAVVVVVVVVVVVLVVVVVVVVVVVGVLETCAHFGGGCPWLRAWQLRARLHAWRRRLEVIQEVAQTCQGGVVSRSVW